MAGTLRLLGRSLLKLGKGAKDIQDLSYKSRVTYPTVHRFVNKPDKVKLLDLKVIPNVLLDGLELTPEEMMELRLKDLFEYVP